VPKNTFSKAPKSLSTFDKFVFEFALHGRYLLLAIAKRWMVLTAQLRGEGFYCTALEGESDYNISINSDMSVSCNCDDVFGRGYLGSLRDHSFQEIFSGPIAMRFRRELAAGRIPILECVKCWELKKTSKEKSHHFVKNYRLPNKGIMVENTAACNLACVGCGRTHRPPMGMRMKLSDISKVADIVHDLGIQKVAYLKLGEPFLSKHILEELTIIKNSNPSTKLSTSTTGMLVNSDKKRLAALMFDVVVFSIDGSSQRTAEKYQRGIDFSVAYSNLRKLVEYRNSNNLTKPIIVWKYVVFNWNHKKGDVLKAIEMARSAGVDRIHFEHSFTPIYSTSLRFRLSRFWRELAPLADSFNGRGRFIDFTDFVKITERF